MKCTYCKRDTLPANKVRLNDPLTRTKDHCIPLCRGGTNTKENKVIACLRCNGVKGNMMPDEWAAYMEVNPMWWTLTRWQRRNRSLGNPPIPYEESIMILKFGKKAWKEWKARLAATETDAELYRGRPSRQEVGLEPHLYTALCNSP